MLPLENQSHGGRGWQKIVQIGNRHGCHEKGSHGGPDVRKGVQMDEGHCCCAATWTLLGCSLFCYDAEERWCSVALCCSCGGTLQWLGCSFGITLHLHCTTVWGVRLQFLFCSCGVPLQLCYAAVVVIHHSCVMLQLWYITAVLCCSCDTSQLCYAAVVIHHSYVMLQLWHDTEVVKLHNRSVTTPWLWLCNKCGIALQLWRYSGGVVQHLC